MIVVRRHHVVLVALLLLGSTALYASDGVKTGIDNLVDTDFSLLRGKHITLVTHAAARVKNGASTAEVLLRRTDLHIDRILAPEHGFYGVVSAGENVQPDSVGSVPVLSLYGALRRPDRSMLEGSDVVVLDLQDIGVRSYTYISTMTEVMDACGEYGLPLMVLDRPNPLGGNVIDGNIPDDSVRNFICRIPVPYVHGCTIGELATMINGQRWIAHPCSLTVVKCKRWKRNMTWSETDLPWYPTSPNIPTIEAIKGYATIGLIGELGLCSIGIGTSTPFTVIGAPDMPKSIALPRRLSPYGIMLMDARFIPATGKYAKLLCSGWHVQSQHHESWKPYMAALALIDALHTMRPQSWPDTLATSRSGKMFIKATGGPAIMDALQRNAPWREIEGFAVRGVLAYRSMRERYLLYP